MKSPAFEPYQPLTYNRIKLRGLNRTAKASQASPVPSTQNYDASNQQPSSVRRSALWVHVGATSSVLILKNNHQTCGHVDHYPSILRRPHTPSRPRGMEWYRTFTRLRLSAFRFGSALTETLSLLRLGVLLTVHKQDEAAMAR